MYLLILHIYSHLQKSVDLANNTILIRMQPQNILANKNKDLLAQGPHFPQ